MKFHGTQGRLALLGLAFVGLSPACGRETLPGKCQPDQPPQALITPDSKRFGVIKIQDSFDHTEHPALRFGQIQAAFSDRSEETREAASTLDFGGFCLGTLSLGRRAGTVTPLSLGQLTVEGTVEGGLTLASPDTGFYYYFSEGSLFGTGPVHVKGTAGSFPAFEAEIQPAAPIEISHPGEGDQLGYRSLNLRWTGQGGQWVDVRIAPRTPGEHESGGEVHCRVADTGCFSVPLEAMIFLGQSESADFNISLTRRVVHIETLPDGSWIQLDSRAVDRRAVQASWN